MLTDLESKIRQKVADNFIDRAYEIIDNTVNIDAIIRSYIDTYVDKELQELVATDKITNGTLVRAKEVFSSLIHNFQYAIEYINSLEQHWLISADNFCKNLRAGIKEIFSNNTEEMKLIDILYDCYSKNDQVINVLVNKANVHRLSIINDNIIYNAIRTIHQTPDAFIDNYRKSAKTTTDLIILTSNHYNNIPYSSAVIDPKLNNVWDNITQAFIHGLCEAYIDQFISKDIEIIFSS